MTEHDIRERITTLRINRRVSEYQMSTDLDQSKGYVQGITSGRSMPSMKMFLNICEYFEIRPSEFFEEQIPRPLERKMREAVRKLSDEDILHVLYIIEKLAAKESKE